MSKERLSAFMDAILAIIMTILVLELQKPSAPTFEAIWALRADFFSYAVSFFWLGAMWVNIHNQWQRIEKITNSVLWLSIIMLFFASLIPYVTSFVAANFNNLFAQLMYSSVVLCVSFSNMALGNAVAKANNDSSIQYGTRAVVSADLIIKAVGILFAVFLYPPCAMFGILLAGFIVTFVPIILTKGRH